MAHRRSYPRAQKTPGDELSCCLVTQSCLTLCDPKGCSMPGLPVHHQLPSLLRLMSTGSLMPSNHLILCRSLLLLPSIFPSIRVFSNNSALYIRWPKDWSFSTSPCSDYSGLIFFSIAWFDLLAVQGTPKTPRVFSSTTVQKYQFFGAQSSLWSNCHIRTRLLEKP